MISRPIEHHQPIINIVVSLPTVRSVCGLPIEAYIKQKITYALSSVHSCANRFEVLVIPMHCRRNLRYHRLWLFAIAAWPEILVDLLLEITKKKTKKRFFNCLFLLYIYSEIFLQLINNKLKDHIYVHVNIILTIVLAYREFLLAKRLKLYYIYTLLAFECFLARKATFTVVGEGRLELYGTIEYILPQIIINQLIPKRPNTSIWSSMLYLNFSLAQCNNSVGK